MMNMATFSRKFTRVLDRMNFKNVKVYSGSGVGGGSLVNGGMAVQPKKEYFKEIFPDLDVEQFWSTYFPLTQKELEVNEIPVLFWGKQLSYIDVSKALIICT